ncbi:hypothetical protein C8Q79DRAFT_460350 [Trametes meyenii]|nr:hypothetical protein C8Q79DRAFT_460350 [Trametes meyenii]
MPMPIHSPVPIRASSTYLPFGSVNAEVRAPTRREGKSTSQKFSRDMINLYDQTFTIASAAEKLYLEHHASSLVPDRMVVDPRRFMHEVQERTLTQPPAIIVTRPPLRRATIMHSTGRLQGNTAIVKSDGFCGCVDSQKGKTDFENSSGLVAVHEMRTDLVEGDAFLDLCIAVEGIILDSVSEKREGQGGHPSVPISTPPRPILRRRDAMCPLRAVDSCGVKDRSTGLSEERLVALIAKLMSFPEDTRDVPNVFSDVDALEPGPSPKSSSERSTPYAVADCFVCPSPHRQHALQRRSTLRQDIMSFQTNIYRSRPANRGRPTLPTINEDEAHLSLATSRLFLSHAMMRTQNKSRVAPRQRPGEIHSLPMLPSRAMSHTAPLRPKTSRAVAYHVSRETIAKLSSAR